MKTKPAHKVLASNKKAGREYETVAKWEAGLSLLGSEVKAIREGSINLKESYIKEIKMELFLVGCHINPYSHSALDGHDPIRVRKLLLHKREIEIITGSAQRKGLTIIPLKMYLKNGKVKLEIATAKGRKLHDKRGVEKAKQADRAMERALKSKASS